VLLRGIKIVPDETHFPFLRYSRVFFLFSIGLVVASIVLLAARGLNYGIDFRGGILIEVRTEGPADIGAMRQSLSGLGLGEVALQEFGEEDDVLIRLERQPGGEEAQGDAVGVVRDALGSNVDYRRVEMVGPQVSQELLLNGVYAMIAAVVGIVVYVWFRFEWQFAVAAIIAEAHDVITTLGIFALLGFEFNLTTVAALLTIAGYSINDTVVVFDRVRENLRKYKRMPVSELLDVSINQTLGRTFNTGLTTLLAIGALYVLGGEVIRGFSFAMIWGIVIGTYSSICVAVPLLLYLQIRGEGKGAASSGTVDPAPQPVDPEPR
jgi:preprotein translocase subunit SecF